MTRMLALLGLVIAAAALTVLVAALAAHSLGWEAGEAALLAAPATLLLALLWRMTAGRRPSRK